MDKKLCLSQCVCLWYIGWQFFFFFLANDLVVKVAIKIPLSTVWKQKSVNCWSTSVPFCSLPIEINFSLRHDQLWKIVIQDWFVKKIQTHQDVEQDFGKLLLISFSAQRFFRIDNELLTTNVQKWNLGIFEWSVQTKF